MQILITEIEIRSHCIACENSRPRAVSEDGRLVSPATHCMAKPKCGRREIPQACPPPPLPREAQESHTRRVGRTLTVSMFTPDLQFKFARVTRVRKKMRLFCNLDTSCQTNLDVLCKGPVALGRICVYFAKKKKTVNECCRRVRPACFFLDKILSDLTKLQRSHDKKSASPLGSPIFCQAILPHFLVCLVSQNPLAPSNAPTGMVSC